ncbi:MAG: hypothetical protein IK020_03760 [Clostridiales bacterium]|nr:hypothetical protein [Clostridiales bacterium]
MKIESLTCPNCAKTLNLQDLSEDVKFAKCPACGAQLHIDYGEGAAAAATPGASKDPRTEIRDDVTGQVLARMVIPEGWEARGLTLNVYQGIDKPFLSQVLAKSKDGSSTVLLRTGEMFLDVLESFDKLMGSDRFVDGQISKALPMVMRRQLPYSNYLNAFTARFLQGASIEPVANAKLPSVLGLHPEIAKRMLYSKYEFQKSWDMSYPNPIAEPNLISTRAESLLRKFTSKENIYMVGMDLTSMEWESNITQYAAAYGMVGMMAMAKKCHGHYVAWGSENIYVCTTDAAHEGEVTAAFMQMVSTFSFDDSVYRRKFDKATEFNRAELMKNQALQAQNAALQQQLRMNQARLQQTLADNSRAMSDMIMDSWNKKMASDSRISQARSEAIMGVNTYVRTDGTTVQHSVVADHVYQNQYGDTVGVSGPAIDPSYIPDWTEIPRG